MTEAVALRNALMQERTGEAPMPGAPTLGPQQPGGWPAGLAPSQGGMDMTAGLPSHLGGDGTHAGAHQQYGEYEVREPIAAPPAAATPPPATPGGVHLSLNVHPDMSSEDITDAVSRAMSAAQADMRGEPPSQMNLSAVADPPADVLQLDEHRKIKCPKCGTVQSASNKTCTNCGHDLTDARKAKFANLSAAQIVESIDPNDADDQALMLALPDFIAKKKAEAADKDKAARGLKKVCPECGTKNKADALECTKCHHRLVGIKARKLDAAVTPIDRQQYGTTGPPNLRESTPGDDPDGDGDTDDACGTCAWFSDGGRCTLYEYGVRAEQICDSFKEDDEEEAETPDEVAAEGAADTELSQDGHLAKIYQLSLAQEANKPGVEQDGLVWKVACKSGTLALSPGPGQIDLEQPLELTGDLFRDMVLSLDEKAFPYCTVPETHANGSLENTGYVEKGVVLDQAAALKDSRIGDKAKELMKLDPPSTEYLLAGIRFTEPEVKQKALNGSIPDTSIGVKFGYRNKRTGKFFKRAWEHLALTPVPWVDGLPAFGLSADDNPRVTDADEALARYDGVYVDFASREALARDMQTTLYMAMPQAERDKKKHKLPDGSFPIDNADDLDNAISAYGRAKNKPRVKRWIVSRAKAMGLTGKVPDGWALSTRRPSRQQAAAEPDGEYEIQLDQAHRALISDDEAKGLDLAMRVSMRGDPYDDGKARAAINALQPGDEWSWNYGVCVRRVRSGDGEGDGAYYTLDAGYGPDEDWERGPTLYTGLDSLMTAVQAAVTAQEARRALQKLRDKIAVGAVDSVGYSATEDDPEAGHGLSLAQAEIGPLPGEGANTPLPEADQTGSLPDELHASADLEINEMSETRTEVTVEQLLAEQQARVEALEAERDELKASVQQGAMQLSAQSVEAHKGRVERWVAKKQAEGLPPALLMAARAVLEADVPGREVGGDEGLNLSVQTTVPKVDDDGKPAGTEQVERKFTTATEIVEYMLSAVPSLSAQDASRIAALGGTVAEFHLAQHADKQERKTDADMKALDEWERQEHPDRFDQDGKRKTTTTAAA